MSKLCAWYLGNYEDIANAKLDHIINAKDKGFKFILREILLEFDYVKPLYKDLHGILFPIHKGELFTSIPKDPEISNLSFDKVIDNIKNMSDSQAL
jgi:hypothetical protein